MPKYRIFNPGPNPAVEIKPGLGVFEIGVEKSIIIENQVIADSLVRDSQGHLQLSIIPDPPVKTSGISKADKQISNK